jgi:CheY-like chemotaxis protein
LTSSDPLSVKCVLIVEDDGDVRESILEVLQDNAYTAIAVSNGAEALARLRSAAPRPCLILLDLMMPVMDGYKFRTAQTSDPVLTTIPVVVLTAQGGAEKTAQDMQAAGFLKKPVKLEALLEVVQRYCDCA